MLIFCVFPHSRAILGRLPRLDEYLCVLRSEWPYVGFCGLVLEFTGVEHGCNSGTIEN